MRSLNVTSYLGGRLNLTDEENIEVVAESLQPQQLTDQGRYIVRYSRVCNGFSNIVRPFMGDDQGYGIIMKHMAAMQSELCAMNKMRASALDTAAKVGARGRQKKKCMQESTSVGQGAACIASRPAKSVGVAPNPTRSAGVASNPTQAAGVASNATRSVGVASNATRSAGGASYPTQCAGVASNVAMSAGAASNPTRGAGATSNVARSAGGASNLAQTAVVATTTAVSVGVTSDPVQGGPGKKCKLNKFLSTSF
jgi:hypothetical protein